MGGKSHKELIQVDEDQKLVVISDVDAGFSMTLDYYTVRPSFHHEALFLAASGYLKLVSKFEPTEWRTNLTLV